MAPNLDPTVLCLVYDFFQSHFALKDISCPLKSEEYVNKDIIQNSEYKRVSNVLQTQGQLYIEEFRERMDSQIQTFLPGLHEPNGASAFKSLSNYFFDAGVDWNHILTYFVFSAELAYHAEIQRIVSVDDIAQWLVQYISEHLLPWINDNGRWVCIFFLFV